MNAKMALLLSLLICAACGLAQAECPDLVAQFGDSDALDLSEFDVFLDLEDFPNGK